MESKALNVLFFGIFFTKAFSNVENADGQGSSYGDTIYASIIFRHGDRTPSLLLPTDSWELSYWEEGLEQLTKVGKLRAYELGKWIRHEYKELVSDKPYRYDVITVNSSDSDRTLMTAELVLAGMYPPSDEEMWNSENLRWQPIPVHSIPRSLDNIIWYSNIVCERYELEKYSINEDPKIVAFSEEHQDLFEYVTAHSGEDIPKDDPYTAIMQLYEVYDTIFIEVQNNRTPEKWTRRVYPEPLKSIDDFSFSLLTYTDEMKRLRAGPLLKSIVDDVTRKATNKMKNTKFHLYSGHDTNIAAVLDALGIFNRLSPPYTAAVIVELRKQNENYYIRVLYRNSSLVAPYILRIPGCESDVCTLDEFIRVTASRIPEDWEGECEVGFLEKLSTTDLVVLVLVALLLVALIVVLGRLYLRIRRRNYENI